MATNLYITRIISLGTLVSIYLTTSDEMLPILISENVGINLILKILIVKLIIGIFWGFLIDFILRKKNKKLKVIKVVKIKNKLIIKNKKLKVYFF